MILYFSGTGNSRYIAEKTAGITGEEILDISRKIRDHDTGDIDAGEKLVFVLPTYAWRIPRIAEHWIRHTRFIGSEGEPAWFVMNCGDEIGNAAKYLKDLAREKKWRYMGTAQIVMPENYIAMFRVPKPHTARKIIAMADPVIEEAAQLVARGVPFPELTASIADRIKSSLVNPVFYKLFVRADAFHATEDCIGCGRCAKVCPLNNIVLKENGPSWGKECTHCMACISLCPEEAIEYGRKSKGKPRYSLDNTISGT